MEIHEIVFFIIDFVDLIKWPITILIIAIMFRPKRF